jgi:hypothetical protein
MYLFGGGARQIFAPFQQAKMGKLLVRTYLKIAEQSRSAINVE